MKGISIAAISCAALIAFICVVPATTYGEIQASSTQGHSHNNQCSHKRNRTLVVDQRIGTIGPDDPCPRPRNSKRYADLGAALFCAKARDTVYLMPGRYIGEWDIEKDLTLRGSGKHLTILDGESVASPVLGVNIGISAKIEHMTIVDGVAFDGAAVGGGRDSPLIVVRHCIFSKNQVHKGVIDNNGGRMKIIDSVFSGNTGPSGSQGDSTIYNLNGGEMRIVRTAIVGNNLGGIENVGGSRVTVRASLISENAGAAIISDESSSVKIRSSVIEGNGTD